MDTRNRSVTAIILKSAPYREQDRLLHIFSMEEGPHVVIARGAMKPEGKLRPLSQAYTRAELLLTPPRNGLSFLAEGRALESYLSLDSGLARFSRAAYMAELTINAVPEQRPAPGVYGLLLAAYTLLKMDKDLDRTVRFFELRFLRELGLMPELTACANCGARISGGRFALAPRSGHLLCEACLTDPAAPLFSSGAVLTMARLLDQPFNKIPTLRINPAIAAELEAALEYYLNYHLEYASRVKAVLRQMEE